MTLDNKCEVLVDKKLTKAFSKLKGPRCIMESLHINYMANYYIHHFMFYNHHKNYVTQLILTLVWKIMHKY
jgi:hypothetical protein